jgi:polyferredoxin
MGHSKTRDTTDHEKWGLLDAFRKIVAYVDIFGFLVFLLLAGLGSFYILQSHNRTHARILQVGTIGVMSAVVLVFPILGVGLFLPGRWYVLCGALAGALTEVRRRD